MLNLVKRGVLWVVFILANLTIFATYNLFFVQTFFPVPPKKTQKKETPAVRRHIF